MRNVETRGFAPYPEFKFSTELSFSPERAQQGQQNFADLGKEVSPDTPEFQKSYNQ